MRLGRRISGRISAARACSHAHAKEGPVVAFSDVEEVVVAREIVQLRRLRSIKIR